jgi:hypothetical protein
MVRDNEKTQPADTTGHELTGDQNPVDGHGRQNAAGGDQEKVPCNFGQRVWYLLFYAGLFLGDSGLVVKRLNGMMPARGCFRQHLLDHDAEKS